MTKKCKTCSGEISNDNMMGVHYYYADCVKQLQSTIKAQENVIRRLKKNSESLASELKLTPDKPYAGKQLTIACHENLMNELEDK